MKVALARLALLAVALWQTAALAADGMRFTAVEVYLDSTAPVAAWQFEFRNRLGGMKVVGVENGENAAFHGTPYYDREAVRVGTADRIVVADYSLAEPGHLPSGRTRIATLHVVLDGPDRPEFELDLVTAVGPDGQPVDAALEIASMTGNER